MANKEIRKEIDWLGREKDVIYEDGKKVGETRHETNLWGTPVDRTYDNDGKRVSETTHETTFFGTSKEVTRDTRGKKLSETEYEEKLFGGKRGVIRQDGKKIGELETRKSFFGERKQVLHEKGRNVDLTRRIINESGIHAREREWDKTSDFGGYTATNKDLAIAGTVLATAAAAIVGICYLCYSGFNKLDKWVEKMDSRPAGPYVRRRPIGKAQAKRIEAMRKKELIEIRQRNTPSKSMIIKQNLERWIKNNFNYRSRGDRIGAYTVEISPKEYSVIGDNIWAACCRKGFNVGMGHLFHSPDGGKSWELLYKNEKETFVDVHFCDADTGFLAVRNRIYKSRDGGRSWSKLMSVYEVTPTRPGLGNINKLEVKDENNLLIRLVANNSIIETSNGGNTWECAGYYDDARGGKVRRLEFISYNGGVTWEKVPENANIKNSRYRGN